MKPDLIWQCHGTQSRINREARFDAAGLQPICRATRCETLRALIAECRIDMPEGLPAVVGGAVRLSRL